MSWASRHNLLARAVNRSLGGVPVIWGAVSGVALLEQNTELVIGGQVLSVEYALHNLPAAQFGNLMYGDELQVDGITYQVRELMRVGDGQFCIASLTRLDPGSSAVGRDPREALRLDDLGDVDLANPAAGEVLKYDGTNWVDAADSSPTYIHTQSTAANTWTINHNLGFKPSVELFDSGSQEIDGHVVHTSNNQVVVTLTKAISGFARLN
ncbi:MAG: hypothetical protein VKM92_09625 [Cyanobacteriota bacterium]|nr:hypothetical protein [Cyanobacteriota bacterium]